MSRRTLDCRLVGALLTVLACSHAERNSDPRADLNSGGGDSVSPFGASSSQGPDGVVPSAGTSEPNASNPDRSNAAGGDGAGTTGEAAGDVDLVQADAGTMAQGTMPGGGSVAGTHSGLYVEGRTLRDRCGEKVVLRGVNEMVIYTASQDGIPVFSEIAKSGANSVRITWNTTGSAAKLDAAMNNAIASQMIPMVVLNDATGDFTKLGVEVDYWVRPDVVAAILKYQDKVLVNIGNEVGDGSVTRADFQSGYESAITRLRGAGIHTPLVIDGSSWGQDIDMLQAVGPGLMQFDPDHNLVFSVHMYWDDADGARLTREINESVAMNLPLIVGEFAQHAVSGCGATPFAYKVLMSVANSAEIGFLPWSWGAVRNGDCQEDQPFDMTNGGRYDALEGWGEEVAVSDPNSIQNTSLRSRYLLTGSCDPAP